MELYYEHSRAVIILFLYRVNDKLNFFCDIIQFFQDPHGGYGLGNTHAHGKDEEDLKLLGKIMAICGLVGHRTDLEETVYRKCHRYNTGCGKGSINHCRNPSFGWDLVLKSQIQQVVEKTGKNGIKNNLLV